MFNFILEKTPFLRFPYTCNQSHKFSCTLVCEISMVLWRLKVQMSFAVTETKSRFEHVCSNVFMFEEFKIRILSSFQKQCKCHWNLLCFSFLKY